MSYKLTDVLKAIRSSSSKRESLEKLGLLPKGGNYATLSNYIITNNIDISHFGHYFKSIPEEIFKELIKSSTSYGQVFSKINLKPSGSNYRSAKLRVSELRIDTSHFLGVGQKGCFKNKPFYRTLKEILVEDSYYQTYKLKKRLIKEGLLKDVCSICGISSWREKPLSLHLDHINGNPRDNRIENLRIICPNCDSQTDTYCGKNKNRKVIRKQ